MARTGRPPKPVEQKRAEGTIRARDNQTPLLIGGRSRPTPSDYLTAGQRERFEQLCDLMEDAGILDAADAGMIELVAIEEAKVAVCNVELASTSLQVENSMGSPMAHPLIAVQEKAMVHLRQLYAELGIGPASRARMQNLGVKGREPVKTLPGIGVSPTPLKAVQ